MKRKLLKQMLNEWRSNVWIVLELVIVVLVLQLIFAILYCIFEMRRPALDTDISDIYVAEVSTLDKDCEGYVPYDSVHSYATDFEMLVTKLRSNPNVEKIGYGTGNTAPYHYSFQGMTISLPGDSSEFLVNKRSMSPEMLEVFGIRGVRGETPAQLAEMMRKGYILLSEAEEDFDPEAPKAADMAGRDVEMKEEGEPKTYHVGAVVQGMRRSDYEPAYYGTCYAPLSPDEAWTIAVRVKPGMGHRFVESLTVADQQAGNLYLTNLTSLADQRDTSQMQMRQTISGITVCALFVLVMIFLGFLGTFWFRTQQRVPEIAIRKVNGASNRDIYMRFFAEGLVLLGIAVVLTLPLTVWIVMNLSDILQMPFPTSTIVVAVVFAIVLLALLIVAGIYAPARKAAAVNAAEALKDM